MKNTITNFVGCDLGDQFSHVCIVGPDGNVVKRQKVATNSESFAKAFAAKADEKFRIVIEAGGHSPWASRLLKSLGHEVVIANPRKVKLISGSDDKSDRVDAERLARLGRADPLLLSPIEHRSEESQNTLIPIKMRRALVETRTSLINFVRGTAKATGIKLNKCATTCFADRARKQLPEDLAATLEPALQIVEQVSDKIAELDEQIEKQGAESAAVQALTQISGVGALTAMTFVHTLDKAARFKRSRDVGAYLGLTPRRSQSGKDDPQLRITKSGDVYLRSLLVSCAHYILGPFGPDSDLKRHGQRIAKDGGKNAKKRAIVAVARKLAVLMHRLWTTGEAYQPTGYGKGLQMAA